MHNQSYPLYSLEKLIEWKLKIIVVFVSVNMNPLLAREINWMETKLSFSPHIKRMVTLYSLEKLIEWKPKWYN